MNYRQRLSETLHFGNPDRPPYWEMGFWGQTVDRWEDEGMPSDVHHVFGADSSVAFLKFVIIFGAEESKGGD